MKKALLLIIIALLFNYANAQLVTVKGKLTAFQEFPVKNIVVVSKKAKTKALTNEAGEFEIKCKNNDVLTVISQGFNKVKYKVKDPEKLIEINLIFKDSEKNREYVVGYGIINEKNLTYAISNLSHRNNDFASYTNIFDLIKAKFPTVQVRGSCIIIRGISTTGNSCALFIVDGIAVNDISYINPTDLKSINILKDSSASIYGARGGNGVVLIETVKYIKD